MHFSMSTSVLVVALISIFSFCLRSPIVYLSGPYTIKCAIFQNLPSLLFRVAPDELEKNIQMLREMKTCFESQ